jgi:Raf kinase inhibitor-like YbhB/YbcL family protein
MRMQLTSQSFSHGEAIPDVHAFATPHEETRVTLSENLNPHLAWTDVPAGTQSFVVTCIDGDVPTRPDDVNQEGREVPADLPRTDFVHWIAIDLPAHLREIAAGEFAAGVVPGGQDAADGPYGCRQGINDYTAWFADDEDMEGVYLGYDGPGPPWNDALIHNYVFTVYALDIGRVPLEGPFRVADVESAIAGHILGRASLTGTYTLNPRLR